MQASGPVACTRKFYRKKADEEVANVLADKDRYPAWRIEQYHVYADPKARFADPSNPDRPPMPPDDPAAADLAPTPQKPGHAGVAYVEGTGYLDLLAQWDAENRLASAAAAAPEADAGMGAAGYGPRATEEKKPEDPAAGEAKKAFLLTLEQAVELGLINSRDYQDARETLYLAALPVTLERFAFAAQFFAAEQIIREVTGRELNADGSTHNRWRFGTDLGFTKLFSTGALLLFRLANQTVVELSGNAGRRTTSVSTATLDLLQPLLAGGGRAVTLEPLTQTERNLLYTIRDYAHFRKEFYVNVVAGGGLAGGVDASLAGLDFNLTTAAFSTSSGYLPALLARAQLNNEYRNVAALEDTYKLLQAYKEGGDVSQLNVDQVEQNVLQARTTVLQRQRAYQDSLDRFKIQLGMPPYVPIDLDDCVLRRLNRQMQSYDLVIKQFEQANNTVSNFDAVEATVGGVGTMMTAQPFVPGLAIPYFVSQVELALLAQGSMTGHLRELIRRVVTTSALVQDTTFRTDFPRRWGSWERLNNDQLKQRIDDISEQRRVLLRLKADVEAENRSLSEADNQRLVELDYELDIAGFERSLRIFETRVWREAGSLERRQRQYAARLRDVLNSFILILGQARNERLVQLRGRWPELPPVVLEDADVVKGELDRALTMAGQTALVNRFDLMNERARLVDSWRKIAVFANALLGTLNVEYNLQSSTPALQARPFAFGGSRSSHRLIIDGELPLVRTAQRNNYRASLIAFQRQRRALMAFEDQVLFTIRQEVRQLRELAQNYRIQQRAVELAYLQVENSLEVFRQPPTPTTADAPPGSGGGAGNAFSLTQQLLQAQNSVVRAQNELYRVWINYQIARLQLFRDLELMPLDLRGVWTDELGTPECFRAGPTATSGPACREPAGSQPGERLPPPAEKAPSQPGT